MRIKTIALLGLAAVLFTSCFKEDIKDLQSQIDALKSGSIATIETQITNINKTIDALEKSQATVSSDVKALLDSEIKNLKAYVDSELKNNENWTKATFATLEQYDELCQIIAQIPGGISYDIEKTIKDWVNDQLTDYYTIAQTQAQIDAIAAAEEEVDSVLFAEVAAQKAALSKAKSEITSSYQAAIKEAIETLGGQLNQKIEKDIADAKAALQSQIDNIKERLNLAEAQIEALLKQVQSIVVVPDYSDGSVVVYDNQIVFDVRPSSVAAEIVRRKDKLSFFDLKIKNVLTKAEDESSEDKAPKGPIYITDVTVNNANQLVVSINSDGRELNKSYSVSLALQYGSTDKRSEYFLLDDLGTAKYERVEAYIALSKTLTSQVKEKTYLTPQIVFNMSSDDVNYGGDNKYIAALNEFSYDKRNPFIENLFNSYYDAILVANKSVKRFANLDLAVGLTPEERDILAQIKTLRAYYYFNLLSSWKNPPFMDEKGNVKVADRKEIFDFCIKELYEDALPNLAERKGPADKEGTTFVTKSFAQALLGKFYLSTGDYAAAVKFLNEVIKSGNYALVPGEEYTNLFHKEGNGSSEKVFEARLYLGDGMLEFGGWNSSRFVADPAEVYSGGINSDGNFAVSQWFGEMFHDNDGESYRYNGSVRRVDEVVYNIMDYPSMLYKNDDLNNMTQEEKKASHKLGIKSNGLKGQSLYLPVKTVARKSDVCVDEFGNEYIYVTVLRYAEVLLDAAEAVLPTGDVAAAQKYINELQNRAGSKTMSSSIDLNAIKKEKSIELYMEGNRQMDIRRWKDEEAIKRMTEAGSKNTILYDKLTRESKKSDKNVVWENGTKDNSRFYTVRTDKFSDGKVGYQDKHEYFPIPASFLSEHPGIKQDPAWN